MNKKKLPVSILAGVMALLMLLGLIANILPDVVEEGQFVGQGQKIGEVGSTGYSTGPHLHFEIHYNGSTVNPAEYVNLPIWG